MQLALPGLEVLSELSSGPVRQVLQARQTDLDRRVRVVCLAPGVSPTSRLADALAREARAYGVLDHVNVPRLFDFRRDEQQSWLVLEDSGSRPLKKALPPPLQSGVAVAVMVQVARALGHAHRRGVMHGRVSIDTVEVTDEGRILLSGFGLSPAGEEEEVEPLELSAAEGAAPETTLGHPPSAASDLFGCGSLLFELLLGRPPFGSAQTAGFESRVRSEKISPLLSEAPQLPVSLDLLTRRCLEKLPSRRPESMRELEQKLVALLDEEPESVLRRALHAVNSSATEPVSGTVGARHVPRAGAGSAGNRERWVLLRSPRWQGISIGLIAGLLLALGSVFLGQRRQPSKEVAPARMPALRGRDAVSLRAVASPWAHVVVDGQHLETTPFATPLALSPGKHEIRFEHPQAAAEVRHIDAAPGESVFLDVVLRVERPLLPAQPLEQPLDDSP